MKEDIRYYISCNLHVVNIIVISRRSVFADNLATWI